MTRHPNCVAFIDAFELEGNLYIVMEFCEGGSVESAMWSNLLTVASKLKILLGVASGVAHLHAANVVHRDLACV